MRVQRLGLAGAFVVLGGLALAAPAQAFVTLGPSLSDPGFGGAPCTFADGCTIGITAAPSGPAVAPFDGVIVRWRFKGDGDNTLRVLRPTGGSAALGAGTGPTKTGAGCATTVEVAARLPIKAGDFIGSDSFSSAGVCGTGVIVPGAGYSYWQPVLQDGETLGAISGGREFAAQVDVEADADQDGFGDETQDKCLQTAGSASGCPSTVAIDTIRRKGDKKVKVTVTAPGAGTLEVGSAADPALASKAARKKTVKAKSADLTAITKQQLTLTLKLTKSAQARLGDRGKLKLKVKALYTPPGGAAGSAIKKKTLKD